MPHHTEKKQTQGIILAINWGLAGVLAAPQTRFLLNMIKAVQAGYI